ncbi:MAG: hypothetical protein V2I43_11710 [Parvularcula sp.]|jgi:hypothetical protein|nr:hypothetical protein [Parvularcula sp.]
MKKVVLGLGALALAISPVAVSAVEANTARAIAPIEGESELAGGASLIIGIAAAAAVIGAIVLIADDDDDDDDLPISG